MNATLPDQWLTHWMWLASAAGAAGLLAMCATWWLTSLVRHWALRRAVIAIPNERSLHVTPTPHGGGLAIVIVVLTVEALLLGCSLIPWRVGAATWLASLCLALLGLRDDIQSMSARGRLLLQILVALGWTLWVMHTMQIALTPAPAPAAAAATAAAATAAATATATADALIGAASVLGIVWLVNLYNFMDGSDGLAAVQAIGAGLIGAALALWSGDFSNATIALLLAASSAGFLCLNWRPAKIFMGDVGAYFLGGQFAMLAAAQFIQTSQPADTQSAAGAWLAHLPWLWLILLAPFVVDATLTLLLRLARREHLASAHRSHAFQLLALMGWSHQRIALGLGALLVLVCLPLATTAVRHAALAPYATLLAYGLLGALWLRIRFYADRARNKSDCPTSPTAAK